MKKCARCKNVKEDSKFLVDKKMKLSLSSYCRNCVNKVKREHYLSNKKKILKIAKIKRLKDPIKAREKEKLWRDKNKDRQKGTILKKYWPNCTWEIALNNFKKLQEQQNNLCAICNKSETCRSKTGSTKLIRDLCVDHCHKTGRVRGLLCDSCNVMIAKAKDSPEICLLAASYLVTGIYDTISRTD